MQKKFIIISLLALLLTSCSEYNRVLKSTDANQKFDYAKKMFEERKFAQSATLLTDVVKVLKGTV